MKITTDTNILVSSTFWTGDSLKIIESVEKKEIDLYLSKEIIEEFSSVLNYKDIQDKIKDKNLVMKRTVEQILTMSNIIEPKRKVEIVKEDIDDNKIIECAVEAGVDYIITKDKHLLKIKEFEGIEIITPEEFVKKIKNFE